MFVICNITKTQESNKGMELQDLAFLNQSLHDVNCILHLVMNGTTFLHKPIACRVSGVTDALIFHRGVSSSLSWMGLNSSLTADLAVGLLTI